MHLNSITLHMTSVSFSPELWFSLKSYWETNKHTKTTAADSALSTWSRLQSLSPVEWNKWSSNQTMSSSFNSRKLIFFIILTASKKQFTILFHQIRCVRCPKATSFKLMFVFLPQRDDSEKSIFSVLTSPLLTQWKVSFWRLFLSDWRRLCVEADGASRPGVGQFDFISAWMDSLDFCGTARDSPHVSR